VAQDNSRLESAAALDGAAIRVAAAELGIRLTELQGDALARYAALLRRWNAVHNLTAIGTPAEVLSHHLLDSLSIVPAIDGIVGERRVTLLDVGSGGGLPGIPLAIARPSLDVLLLDKVQKKTAFLTQAIVELGLSNAHAIHGRVEALAREPFTLVVSRAFASLEEFVRLTRHLVAPGGWWLAMKGVLPTAEIGALRSAHPEVRLVDAIKLSVPRLGAERHLILLQRP
jgi:16S rRNA (guanine527-N7)-methyltransferase